MKKIITFAALSLCTGIFAQSFSIYKTNNSGTPTYTITNGGGFQETTSPNGLVTSKILLRNNAATTQTFSAIRRILFQTPALIVDGSSNDPNTYFCFGNTCFQSNISAVDPSNYIILLGAGQTSTAFPSADNSNANNQPVLLYLEEAPSMGQYIVQYKVFNMDPAKLNDTLSFKVGYNMYVGLNDNTLPTLSADIYPNPTNASSQLYVDLTKDDEMTVKVYNSLGALVYSGNKQKFSEGRNTLPVSTADLSNGVYFVTFTGSNATATRRLIVNK